MTPWQWWAGAEDEVSCGEWQLGEFDSREEAIRQANRAYQPGTSFFVIEARSSTSLKYEGAEIVPFLRTRNKERLIAGARLIADAVNGGEAAHG